MRDYCRLFIFQKSGLKPPTSVGKDPTVRRRRSKPLNPSTLVGGGSVKDLQQLSDHASLQTAQRYIEGDALSKVKVVDLV